MTVPPGEDRLDRLERRVAALERLVRELAARAGVSGPPTLPRAGPAPPAPASPTTAPRARPAFRDLVTPAPGRARQPSVDLEQWFGARGLLLVGVVALLAATGFFLNYAFERGWIPPWVRVTGAVASGIGVAVAGERLITRAMRRYGLALVGTGMGLAYLGIWAAAGPFAMLPRLLGIGLIALTTGLAAWRAAHHRAEALALWALLGALMAPALLPAPAARPEALLAYLAVVGGAALLLATRFSWQLTADLGVVGYFTVAVALVFDTLPTPAGMGFLALGAAAALVMWRRHGWVETRLAGFTFGWLLLAIQGGRIPDGGPLWAGFGIGAALLLAEWAHARTVPALALTEVRFAGSLESATFLVGPLMFVLLADTGRPPLPGQGAAVPALGAALLYLGAGWPGRRAPFVSLGFGLLALGAAIQFDGALVIAVWSGLVAVAVAADRWLEQRAGPAVAVLLGVVAGLTLFTVTLADRAAADPAFTGDWALALYGYLTAIGLAALWWRQRDELPAWLAGGRSILWTLVGLAVFGGVSLEIGRFFDSRLDAWPAARLAGDLCLSVFWLLFAGITVWLGFRRDDATVRGAGLVVAGVAAGKIAVYDLSRLQALYRVGSFFVLALLALAVAYGYNRQAARRASPPTETHREAAS